jgi:hypothetical protein
MSEAEAMSGRVARMSFFPTGQDPLTGTSLSFQCSDGPKRSRGGLVGRADHEWRVAYMIGRAEATEATEDL